MYYIIYPDMHITLCLCKRVLYGKRIMSNGRFAEYINRSLRRNGYYRMQFGIYIQFWIRVLRDEPCMFRVKLYCIKG